jgi:hypothetical protein
VHDPGQQAFDDTGDDGHAENERAGAHAAGQDGDGEETRVRALRAEVAAANGTAVQCLEDRGYAARDHRDGHDVADELGATAHLAHDDGHHDETAGKEEDMLQRQHHANTGRGPVIDTIEKISGFLCHKRITSFFLDQSAGPVSYGFSNACGVPRSSRHSRPGSDPTNEGPF